MKHAVGVFPCKRKFSPYRSPGQRKWPIINMSCFWIFQSVKKLSSLGDMFVERMAVRERVGRPEYMALGHGNMPELALGCSRMCWLSTRIDSMQGSREWKLTCQNC